MEVYNYTIYHSFVCEPRKVWLNKRCLEIIPEFQEIEIALEEKDMLSYCLLMDGRSVGRLLFPWMDCWKYEGDFFDEKALRDIGRHVYYWIGLWE